MKAIRDKDEILIVHERCSIGGGQYFVNAYKKILLANNLKFDFAEGLTLPTVTKALRYQYSRAFLHLYTPLSLSIVILLALKKVPTIITVYGLWFLEFRSQHTKGYGLHIFLWKIVQGIIFLFAEKIIVFSRYEERLIKKYYPEVKNKTVIIPGGVDRDSFYPVSDSKKAKIRSELNLPENKKIMLLLSRLDSRKGLDIAIDAFSKLSKFRNDLFLCVVFPTDKKANQPGILEDLYARVNMYKIGDKVRFITGIPRVKIPNYYQSSDVFVMSSRDLETFGLTTIEAASCGCIPVGFRSGATPEIVSKIDTDLLAYPINSSVLADRIDWVISLNKKRKSCILAKCQKVASYYDWENISNKLIGLFET